MNLLFADSGSTKTDWRFCAGSEIRSFQTKGFNPYYYATSEDFAKALRDLVAPQLPDAGLNHIFFYGAGCAAEERKALVRDGLRTVFPDALLEINDDLLGAARGLLQNETGFIAILGTGMNNGLYDGEKIVFQLDSLGYILGDEGSGTAIGKRLLKAYLRKEMSAELNSAFKDFSRFTRDEIIKTIYSGNNPSYFIAGFAQFAFVHQERDDIKKILEAVFKEFFEAIVVRYPDYQELSFNCAGSVGYYFKATIEAVAFDYGMKTGEFVQSPIEGLMKFHWGD